jgi:hypothetical protein
MLEECRGGRKTIKSARSRQLPKLSAPMTTTRHADLGERAPIGSGDLARVGIAEIDVRVGHEHSAET